MRFLTWLRRKRFPYESLITVEISKGALLHNLAEFHKFAPNNLIAPVLKANAYGHGLLEVAHILEKHAANIPFFCVDSYFEAVALRTKHIHTPILIIGYTRPETIKISRLSKTTFAVTSLETLKSIELARHDINIQIKIDTGMHRQGIRPEEIPETIEILKNNPSINLEGIYTHFSDADNEDEAFTESQIRIWNKLAKNLKIEFPDMKYIHAAATDGSRFSRDIYGNVIRLGIGLYGLSDNGLLNSELQLQPALKIRTIITAVKKLNRGETVGYGNIFKAENDMRIATIPIGYSEGMDRRMSNNGAVQVGPDKTICPIIGRVSMNIITIDISKLPNPTIGMDVIVASNVTSDLNSIRAIARNCKTIPYEIAVKIPAQLKRVEVD